MKKLLFSTAALAVLVMGASVVSADVKTGTTEGATDGRNMYYDNQLIQKSYVSDRDAYDEAHKYLAGHAADLEAIVKNDVAVVEAQNALNNIEAGHDYEEKAAAAKAAYEKVYNEKYSTLYNQELVKKANAYIDAAKAQGNYHNEGAIQANKPNDMRIEEDYEKNTGKKIKLNQGSESEASKSTEEAVKSAVEAAKKDAAKVAKKDAAKKDGQKVLPNTSAVK